MSQTRTIAGVGRLHRGSRNLGCVGYWFELTASGSIARIKFDPVPDSVDGEVFSLTLGDGRIVECQAVAHDGHFQVLGSGPHPERRTVRREALGRLLA